MKKHSKKHTALTWLSRDERPLSRRDVVNALLGTSAGGRGEEGRELRFQVPLNLSPLTTTCNLSSQPDYLQGTDLSGADLSRLDLRHINFK